jgi:nucleoside-triphosphatase THEP1
MIIKFANIKDPKYLMEYYGLPNNDYKTKLQIHGKPIELDNDGIAHTSMKLTNSLYMNLLDGSLNGQTVARSYVYQKDDKGQNILDENGQKLLDYHMYARNSNGSYKKNLEGKKIIVPGINDFRSYGHDIVISPDKAESMFIATLPPELQKKAIARFMDISNDAVKSIVDFCMYDKNGNQLYQSILSTSFFHPDARPVNCKKYLDLNYYKDNQNFTADERLKFEEINNSKSYQSYQVHSHNVIPNTCYDMKGKLRSVNSMFQTSRNTNFKMKVLNQTDQKFKEILKNEFGAQYYLDEDRNIQIKGIHPSMVKTFSMRSAQIQQQAQEKSLSPNIIANLERQKKIKGFSFYNFREKSRIDVSAVNQAMYKISGDPNQYKYNRATFLDYFQEKKKSFSIETVKAALNQLQLFGIINNPDTELNALGAYMVADPTYANMFYTKSRFEAINNELRTRYDVNNVINSKLNIFNDKLFSKSFIVNGVSYNYNQEQIDAITKLTTSNKQINVLVAGAGTGKTTVLNSICDMYEKQGFTVIGAAPTFKATSQLNTKYRYTTEKLLSVLNFHQKLEENWNGHDTEYYDRYLQKSGLSYDDLKATIKIRQNKKVLLIVDESTMLNVKSFSKIQKLLQKNKNMKIIYSGDTKQLKSFDTVETFSSLVHDDFITKSKLETCFRQQNSVDNKISTSLNKNQDIVAACLQYRAKGDVYLCDSKNNLNAKIVDSYIKDPTDIINKVVITSLNASNDEINKSIQKRLYGRGQKKYSFLNSVDKSGQHKVVSFYKGDKVIFTNENKAKGYKKGQLGVIKSIDYIDNNRYTIIVDVKGKLTTIYNQATVPIELGYAVTSHKEQGSTEISTHIGFNQFSSSDMKTVELTRHTKHIKIYSTNDTFNYILAQETAKKMKNETEKIQKDYINQNIKTKVEPTISDIKPLFNKLGYSELEQLYMLQNNNENKKKLEKQKTNIKLPIITKKIEPIKPFTLPETYEKSKTLRGL